MKIQSHTDLIVWQKAMDLVTLIYQLTEGFPSHELYGIVSQMRRAAVSIPSNIAEGRRRGTKKDFRHFLINSFGSGAELETQIEIAKRLGYGKRELYPPADSFLSEVMKMLNRFIASLE